jgi:hypothetical protein
LVLKRVRIFRRDAQQLICEVFLPILVVIGGLSILTIKFVVDSPAAPISLSEYPSFIPTPSLMSYDSTMDQTKA